ncbi:MAG: methionine--tRNA ligase [Kiritimatiellae bacterium]|nr:methionine--tRNA ligase [Kiritimatiellia bacterium]
MKKSFYVTTPIYYVNDKPHIGHAYTTLLADVLARYHRLLGDPTLFLTGTDEHGQKVQRAADRAGVTPQEQADTTVVRFQELWKKLGITHDDFIRTTEPRHARVVQRILQDLYDRDEIYRSEYDGWYCVPCERFFMEKDLRENTCPECGRAVEHITESNYFFRMGKYQDWLVRYIQEHPTFIQPDFRRNETLGFLRRGLNDLCISRPKTRLAWGIELPFDSDYVTYVWFDALVNYISAIGYLADDARFRQWWPATYHLIGKDILTTHTVYWPTMLKAMGVAMPETVFAHGWWLVEESKMSKSLGNVVNPMEMADRYGVDAFRYFLMAEMTLGQDANFSEESFVRRYNTYLANDLGNLLSRVMKLVASHCGGRVPAPGQPGPDEEHLRDATLAASAAMEKAVNDMRLDVGLAEVAGAVREANRYLERRQPWTLAKQADAGPLGTVLYSAAESLRIVSGLLYPTMPAKMTALRQTLGLSQTKPDMAELKAWGKLPPGTAVGEMTALFPRVKLEREPETKQTRKEPEMEGVVEFSDFKKLDLRTARVLAADKVEGADKLLRLQVEIGGETRQIVAGIARHYSPEQMAGRTIVVVVNLKPAKIRGVESNGMLLAAVAGEDMLRLVTIDGDIPSGTRVQ